MKLPSDWKKSIADSGILFEQQVAATIEKSGFGWVVPNYAFTDVEQGSSRELDVFAISGRKISHRENYIFPVLLASIKKISVVCLTRKIKNNIRHTIGNIQYSGLPKHIGEDDLLDFLHIERFHHFYKLRNIASQFWLPKETPKGENLYKDMLFPLIKAVVAERRSHEKKEWEFSPEGEQVNIQFYYPVVVVENLWASSVETQRQYIRKTDHVGFLSHFSSEKAEGDFHIDFCTPQYLKQLLAAIQSEAELIKRKIRSHQDLFEKSAYRDAVKRKMEDERRDK